MYILAIFCQFLHGLQCDAVSCAEVSRKARCTHPPGHTSNQQTTYSLIICIVNTFTLLSTDLYSVPLQLRFLTQPYTYTVPLHVYCTLHYPKIVGSNCIILHIDK